MPDAEFLMQPHEFWQEVHPRPSLPADGPFETFYPAGFADGRQLRLPIRPLPDDRHALASLIINQASFAVVEALADDLARRIAPLKPDVVVGLPTLGLTLAAALARHLAHTRYVPLGTSRKFWYEERLSVPLSSITTPEQVKRLYVDPRMLPLMEGKRVVLVDDVISSGSSIVAGLRLMQAVGIAPVAIGAAMLQSDRWQSVLDTYGAGWRPLVHGVLQTPILSRDDEGLWR
jgi:adenine/guanine phosphoribosyltransferase-like PRPP-binding protein